MIITTFRQYYSRAFLSHSCRRSTNSGTFTLKLLKLFMAILFSLKTFERHLPRQYRWKNIFSNLFLLNAGQTRNCILDHYTSEIRSISNFVVSTYISKYIARSSISSFLRNVEKKKIIIILNITVINTNECTKTNETIKNLFLIKDQRQNFF